MPKLLAFKDSVYSWSAKAGLAIKGVDFEYEEINPFDPADQARLVRSHPLGRVPVLSHDGFTFYETLAILAYLDGAFAGPDLLPKSARARARALQVAQMVGAYVYQPFVRQVFSHGVYRPLMSLDADAVQVDAGLEAAKPVLAALEAIVCEGEVLNGAALTVADLMLAPMLSYFSTRAAADRLLAEHRTLAAWLVWAEAQPALKATRPDFFQTLGETS